MKGIRRFDAGVTSRRQLSTLLALVAVLFWFSISTNVAHAATGPTLFEYKLDFESGVVSMDWSVDETSAIKQLSVVSAPSPVVSGTRSFGAHVYTFGDDVVTHSVPSNGTSYTVQASFYHSVSTGAPLSASSILFLEMSDGSRVGVRLTPQAFGSTTALLSGISAVPAQLTLTTNAWHVAKLQYNPLTKTVTFSLDGTQRATTSVQVYPGVRSDAVPIRCGFGVSEGFGATVNGWVDGQETNTYFDDVAVLVSSPNSAPLALPDTGAALSGSASLIDVLSNDVDIDRDQLSASVVVAPSHGVATWDATARKFTYTSTAGYYGTDSFSYRAFDGTDYSGVSVVTVDVARTNRAPVATDDPATSGTLSVNEDTRFYFAAPGVLRNDVDADRDALTAEVLTEPAHGSVVLEADGSFTYMPDPDYFGPDSFTYTSSDNLTSSAPATVRLNVVAQNDPPVAADDPKLEASLSSPDAAAGDGFGDAVAVDGDTAVIGASGLRCAYVYRRGENGAWEKTDTLTSFSREYGFGESVAISGDRIAVASASEDQVHLFKRQGGVWVEQVTLSDNDRSWNRFGCSIALSAESLLVGTDPLSSRIGGAVYAYKLDALAAAPTIIRAPDAATRGFGHSVAISGDTALIGRPNYSLATSTNGAVYVYRRVNGLWVYGNQRLGVTGSWRFGDDVAIDSGTAVVGAATGAYVCASDTGGVWSAPAKLSGLAGYAVESVDVSDGRICVGSMHEDDENSQVDWRTMGAASVYEKDSSGLWVLCGRQVERDGKKHIQLGYKVAATGSGMLIASRSYSVVAGDDAMELRLGSGKVYTYASFQVPAGSAYTIPLSDLLSNDIDAESSSVVFDSFTQPAHGTVTRSGDSLTYQPVFGYLGSDSFTYRCADAQSTSAPARVSLTVLRFGKTIKDSTLTLGATPTASGWITSSPVAVSVIASDQAFGVASVVATVTGPAGVTQFSSTVSPLTFSVSGDGVSTVRWKATNRAGESATGAAEVRIDRSVPAPSAPTVRSTGWNRIGVSWPAVPDSLSGVQDYTVMLRRGTMVVATQTTTATATGFSDLTPGSTYWVWVVARDRAGNKSTSSPSVSITCPRDTSAPIAAVAVNPAANMSGWITSAPATMGITATDNVSGVASIVATVTGPSGQKSARTSTSSVLSMMLTEQGLNVVDYVVSDAAGNITSGKASFKIDSMVPSPSKPATAALGYKSATISWPRVTDSESGLRSYTVKVKRASTLATSTVTTQTSATFTSLSEGTTYTVSVTAVDNVGNTSDSPVLTFSTLPPDRSGPVVAVVSSPAPGSSGWVNAAGISVSINATDVGSSGVASIVATLTSPSGIKTPYSGVGQSLTIRDTYQGIATIDYVVTDRAGNVSRGSASCRLDSLIAAPAKPSYSNLTSTSVNVSWVPVSDAGSGIKDYVAYIYPGSNAPIIQLTTTASTFRMALETRCSYTVVVLARDFAGNVSPVSSSCSFVAP